MKYFYVLIIFWNIVYCDEHTHTYKDGHQVVPWMNTVGPYHNPQETYAYFSLPFCVGTKLTIGHYHETLSEALQGVELEFSGLNINYKENVLAQQFCAIELNDQSYKALVYAVKNYYWYQMYIDDLPIWGTVGEIDGDHYYIWTHKKFDIGYNGNRIVEVNLTAENKERLTPDAKIPFTYEVNWKKSYIHFEDRFDKYLDSKPFQNRIHWFIIFNNFMMVIFLVGLVLMFLKGTIRKDHARCSTDNDLDDLEKVPVDEYGWKQVHGDIFRPVPHLPLFSALIGSGYQLTVVTVAVIIFTIIGELYTERGSILSTAIFIYAATSPINGYVGGSLYVRMGGKLWIKQILLSAFLLPVLVCGTALFINFIAMYYHTSKAIPFGSMIAVISICSFVIMPLTFVGTMRGRNLVGQLDYPCQMNAFPRPIPEKKWLMQPIVIMLVGGLLPFGSIIIEMHFIFKSLWAYKIYYEYGILLLVFLILMIVTISVTIVYIYFLLSAEDYHWQWTSFFFAGSTAIYVYLYAFYYFLFKTQMSGLFQTIFYFGYMALFSLAVGIICGTVGFASTGILVRKLYSPAKIRQRNITFPLIILSLSAIMLSFALLLAMSFVR